jgi:hypothetical protein
VGVRPRGLPRPRRADQYHEARRREHDLVAVASADRPRTACTSARYRRLQKPSHGPVPPLNGLGSTCQTVPRCFRDSMGRSRRCNT